MIKKASRGNYYYYGSYGEKHLTDSKTIEPLNNIYEFYSGDSLESEMKRALDVTTKVMLKIFENVTSLEKCLDFFNYFNMDIRIRYMEDFGNHYAANYFNEGLLIIKTMNLEQYSQLIDNHNIMEIEQMKNSISKGAVLGESVLIENELFKNEKIGIFKEAVCDTDWMIKANVEISNRQKNNYRLLKEYRMI